MNLSRRRVNGVASRIVRALAGAKTLRAPGLQACPRGRYVASKTARGSPGHDDRYDATVVFTSRTAELLTIARSFVDDEWPVYVVDGSERCYGLSAIEHVVEHVPARWAVMLDEDAFVLDNARLRGLLVWAAGNSFAAVGVPDGGVIANRIHNPNALNSFFNILDLDSIRGVWDARRCRRWEGRGAEMTRPWPPPALLKPDVPYQFDDFEPYYCFYFWLADAGLSTGYLDAREHSDGLSTIVLDHEQEPIVIHTWYARKFDDGSPMRERILDAAAFARGDQDRGDRWRGYEWPAL